eukprot:m.112732 g.112732  ORF g.112732 m.112732 type:complete len:415 (-) comp14098_c0_seq3:243-1487(-)
MAIEIISDQLYFQVLSRAPADSADRIYFSIDTELYYEPFYKDFGPLNMAMLYRFVSRMDSWLESPLAKKKKIIHWTGPSQLNIANAAYLMAAYQVVSLERRPTEACKFLESVEVPLVPFRDASYNNSCEYKLTIPMVAKGLYQGILHSWLNLKTFDIVEYEHYEQVENGDLNWVVPRKFIAFAGPHRQRQREDGYPLLAPEDYVSYFKRGNVTDVIRLNNVLYGKERFERSGFKHHDLFFVDGSVPPQKIIDKFLEIVEAAKGAVAVHCKAGLGRTGTLIACWMMKHYKMTAGECIGWLRVNRPGSVLGPQQYFLEDVQAQMWALADSIGVVRKSEKGEEAVASLNISDIKLSGKKYAAPETTAPAGVEQGDYLNAQKLRREAAEKEHLTAAAASSSLSGPALNLRPRKVALHI